MTKIAIVGAGSLVFTRVLVSDLLQQEATADAEIHLVDVDENRLNDARKVVENLGARAGRPIPIVASTDCGQGVRGCEYVISTIQVGGRDATRLDFDIPEKFGIRQTIADTHGIGGISRALRTVPPVLEIARNVAELTPGALLLNYTNPMGMVVMALAQTDSAPSSVGLCHGTEHTAAEIAGYLELPDVGRLSWQAAGINHMTWFLRLSVDGTDVYPALREFARSSDLSGHGDSVRLELLRRFGYFVSESSVHNAEYYPWFLRESAQIDAYGIRVREYLHRLDDLRRNFEEERTALTATGDFAPLDPHTKEYAPRVIAALESNTTFRFMGNVVNSGPMIANLPTAACVEVPCFVDGRALVPGFVGHLPEQCAALNRNQISVQLLTVAGIMERRLEMVYQAAFLDPLLSAQLTLDEIRDLVDEIVAAHGNPSDLH